MEIYTFLILMGTFAGFMVLNLRGSKLFGIVAALLLAIMGVWLIADDLQIPNGFQEYTDNSTGTNITIRITNYTSASNLNQQNPYGILGLIFVLTSMYIGFANAMAWREKIKAS